MEDGVFHLLSRVVIVVVVVVVVVKDNVFAVEITVDDEKKEEDISGDGYGNTDILDDEEEGGCGLDELLRSIRLRRPYRPSISCLPFRLPTPSCAMSFSMLRPCCLMLEAVEHNQVVCQCRRWPADARYGPIAWTYAGRHV